MFCLNCGKEIPDGSVFCPECGVTIQPAQSAPVYQSAPGYRSAAPYQSAPGYQSAAAYQGVMPAAPAKKGLSKGALIGIIAGGAAVIVLAVVLILTLGGKSRKPADLLVGTWESVNTNHTFGYRYKAGGTVDAWIDDDFSWDDMFTWTVDSNNTLTITGPFGGGTSYRYDKDKAKEDGSYCWYIEGDTMYESGTVYKRQ